MAELTISDARKALLDLPEKLARTPERALTITRRGRPVLAISVLVVAVGRRRSGDKSDIYELARKLLRQGLVR